MTTLTAEQPDLHPSLVRAVNRMSRSGLDPRVSAAVLERGVTTERFPQAWSAEGARWRDLAADADASGKAASAATWYRQAFYCYRLTEFVYTENVPEKLSAYDASVACFEGAVRHARNKPEPVTVTAAGGDFRGYLAMPEGSEDVPVVVHLYGADGNKEEHYWSTALHLLARGMGVLIVDGPGQGWSVRHGGIAARPDIETITSACADYLATVDRADPDRFGVMGSSMGGYYAPRAFLLEERFRACLVNSALFDVVAGLWDFYPPIRPQLAYNIQAPSLEEAGDLYADFTLSGITNVDPSRPSCIYHGGADKLIPVSEAHRTAEAFGPNTEVVIWEGGGHNLGNVGTEARPRMYDWLMDHLTK
ncbi:MAG: alpha/beta fold hydrolase [Nitriliruptorales bacterium]|nr:alpha/beta fold hydrolase [Nitriliruptorales bacterium]